MFLELIEIINRHPLDDDYDDATTQNRGPYRYIIMHIKYKWFRVKTEIYKNGAAVAAVRKTNI